MFNASAPFMVFLCFINAIENKMKTPNKTLNSSLLSIVMIAFFGFISQAQQGTILTTVSTQMAENIAARGIQAGQTDAELGQVITAYNVTSLKKAFPASRQASLQHVVEFTCDCDIQDLYKTLSEKGSTFKSVEMVEAAEVLTSPDDYTMAGSDYGLNLINAQGAWDITHGDSSVVIAITDAGYHYGHEELVGKYVYVSANPNTNISHGTGVAITAAGWTNNGIGKSAIGYKSSLQLRAMNYNDVLEATYSGAKVINMSWSSGCYYSSYHQSVIDEVYNNGSIVVAAAGNGGTCGGPSNLVYPAAYDHVIAVSSVGPYDNHERYIGNASSTHQHNSSVDICAPGYDLLISWAPGTYGPANGTSFASPLVSGTVALMLAVNPCLNFEQVETFLKNTAVNIDAQNPNYIGQLGAGRLDAGAAVYAAAHFETFPLEGSNTWVCETMEQGITLDLSNVSAPYTIEWNTGATTSELNNVAPGNYEAIVRDASGCLGVFTTTIDSMSVITVDAAIVQPLCHNGASGSIELITEGGHGNYSYSWSNGSAGKNLYNLLPGVYEVTVTDGKGCSVTETYELNNPAEMIATLNIENNNYLNEGSIDLSVSGGVAPFTYTWNNGSVTEDLGTVAVGFYEVLVTDANGCMASANGFMTSTQTSEINAEIHGTAVGYDAVKAEQDGEGAMENATASLENEEAQAVKVGAYPNPSSSQMTITWEGTSINEMIVHNLMGQVVTTRMIQSMEGSVQLEQLPAGQYIVQLTNEKGNTFTHKVTFQ